MINITLKPYAITKTETMISSNICLVITMCVGTLSG